MGTALADEADEISLWCVLLKTFVLYCTRDPSSGAVELSVAWLYTQPTGRWCQQGEDSSSTSILLLEWPSTGCATVLGTLLGALLFLWFPPLSSQTTLLPLCFSLRQDWNAWWGHAFYHLMSASVTVFCVCVLSTLFIICFPYHLFHIWSVTKVLLLDDYWILLEFWIIWWVLLLSFFFMICTVFRAYKLPANYLLPCNFLWWW